MWHNASHYLRHVASHASRCVRHASSCASRCVTMHHVCHAVSCAPRCVMLRYVRHVACVTCATLRHGVCVTLHHAASRWRSAVAHNTACVTYYSGALESCVVQCVDARCSGVHCSTASNAVLIPAVRRSGASSMGTAHHLPNTTAALQHHAHASHCHVAPSHHSFASHVYTNSPHSRCALIR